MERTKGRGDARQKNPVRRRMLPWDRQHLASYTGLDTQALDSIPPVQAAGNLPNCSVHPKSHKTVSKLWREL